MSKRPQKESVAAETPLICDACGKTFRNLRILNAHRLHTHQIKTELDEVSAQSVRSRMSYKPPGLRTKSKKSKDQPDTAKVHLHKCPVCNLKHSSYMMIYRHIQAQHCTDKDGKPVEKDSPHLVQPGKVFICRKCHTEVDDNNPHKCNIAAVAPKSAKFLCSCGRQFVKETEFDAHIPKYHGESMACYFFPDYPTFLQWKKVTSDLTNVIYTVRDSGATSVKQHWSCQHADSLKQACPSAIVVDTFDTGVLVTMYTQHSNHRVVNAPVPLHYSQYSLRALRPVLQLADGVHGAEATVGLLKHVAERVGTLDKKHLRLVQGKVLDLIMLLNDPHALGSDLCAGGVTSSRPIDNMIGQRVAKVKATESEATATKQQRLEDLQALAENMTNADKKNTIQEIIASAVSKSLSKLSKIAPESNSLNGAANEELNKVASVIEPIVKKGKVDAPKSKPINKKPQSEPIIVEESASEPVDIEEQITEIITNSVPVSSKNSPKLGKRQDSIEPVYSTKSPSLALTKSPASYVDTFKDFLQKNTAHTIEYSKDMYIVKRGRKSNNIVNDNTKSKRKINSKLTLRNQGSRKGSISLENMDIKIDPDYEEVTIEENDIKSNTILTNHEKVLIITTRRNRGSRKRLISESLSDQNEMEDMENDTEDVDVKLETDYEEIAIEENEMKSKWKSNTPRKTYSRRNPMSRKRSVSEQSEEREIEHMEKEIQDTDIKMEPDYEEITIEENDICKIEDYEVMEREDDCNILILKI